MVTAVTVTVFTEDLVLTGVIDSIRHRREEGLMPARERIKGKRGRVGIYPSFGFAQTIMRLYPNNRPPICKRSCHYTQIQTQKNQVIIVISSHQSVWSYWKS